MYWHFGVYPMYWHLRPRTYLCTRLLETLE